MLSLALTLNPILTLIPKRLNLYKRSELNWTVWSEEQVKSPRTDGVPDDGFTCSDADRV